MLHNPPASQPRDRSLQDETARSVVAEAQLLAKRASVQRGRVLGYVLGCLRPVDWVAAKPLVQAIWTSALERHELDFFGPVTSDGESGLAGPLLSAANAVLREYLHPASFAVPAVPEERPAAVRRLTPMERHFVEQYAVTDLPPLADVA